MRLFPSLTVAHIRHSPAVGSLETPEGSWQGVRLRAGGGCSGTGPEIAATSGSLAGVGREGDGRPARSGLVASVWRARVVGRRTQDVGRRMWDVGCGTGCGMWDAGEGGAGRDLDSRAIFSPPKLRPDIREIHRRHAERMNLNLQQASISPITRKQGSLHAYSSVHGSGKIRLS